MIPIQVTVVLKDKTQDAEAKAIAAVEQLPAIFSVDFDRESGFLTATIDNELIPAEAVAEAIRTAGIEVVE